PPCLSLYQPTHRHHPDNLQDPIRYRNLIKSMEESLQQKYTNRHIGPLIEPFQVLADDRDFWNHALDGLAILGAPGLFRVYRVQRPVPEVVIVADSFHIKPLMRILQSANRYQVLGLNRREMKLFEGNRDALDEIEPADGVPRTISDALGEELTESPTLTAFSPSAGRPAIRHGYGSKQDEVDIDAERFFRAVDRAVLEHHSRPSGLPLILAALPEHHYLFRQITQNPFLLAAGIDIHPDGLRADALRERAWRVVEPQYLARVDRLVEVAIEHVKRRRRYARQRQDLYQRIRSEGLKELIKVAEEFGDKRVVRYLEELDEELDRAEAMKPQEIPNDVITMNSTFR